jgi:hypothetical protein
MNKYIAKKLARLAITEKDFPECYLDYINIIIERVVCIDTIKNEYEIIFKYEYDLTTKMYEYRLAGVSERYILQCIENDENATLYIVENENRLNPRKIKLTIEK